MKIKYKLIIMKWIKKIYIKKKRKILNKKIRLIGNNKNKKYYNWKKIKIMIISQLLNKLKKVKIK